MKKLLVIAVALASVNASATRARLNSLSNSRHVIDTQSVYRNPADMFYIGGDYVNLESGNTVASTGDDGAEGMVTRTMGNSKMGLSLGHDTALGLQLRKQSTILPQVIQQNPIELTYGMKAGDMAFAGTLVYSNYVNKLAPNEKENSLGFRAGMRMGAIDADLGVGLGNTYQNDTSGKYTGTLGVILGAGIWFDTLYVSGNFTQAGFKDENAAGTETKKFASTSISANILESIKKDGNDFFYGVGLSSDSYKETVNDTKITSLNMPFVIGMEQKATSWLTLRGSITQSVLINNYKAENAGPGNAEYGPGKNNTSVAIGAGLNFDKVTLDGTLKGLTTTVLPTGTTATANQELSGNTLLGSVGLTYMF